MTGNGAGADPLGIGRLLEISAEALEASKTPADAIRRLAEAIDSERERRAGENAQIDRLLREWTRHLHLIAPILPDIDPTETPALGPFPRHQDLLRELAKNSEHYQAALADYLEALTSLAEDCTTAFRETLEARYPGQFDTLFDDIADLDTTSLTEQWQAIAEPRYEQWLATPKTQDRIAALINAWSRLTQTLKNLADEFLEGLGLPSSRGIDDLAAELQRQRRQHRSEINALREEIAALRALHQPQQNER